MSYLSDNMGKYLIGPEDIDLSKLNDYDQIINSGTRNHRGEAEKTNNLKYYYLGFDKAFTYLKAIEGEDENFLTKTFGNILDEKGCPQNEVIENIINFVEIKKLMTTEPNEKSHDYGKYNAIDEDNFNQKADDFARLAKSRVKPTRKVCHEIYNCKATGHERALGNKSKKADHYFPIGDKAGITINNVFELNKFLIKIISRYGVT